MSVKRNPFERWIGVRDVADYRSRETQMSSLTRQMLSSAEYLRDRNRVNPGPSRNLRARHADQMGQVPHLLGNEDMWGWQKWTEPGEYLTTSSYASGLKERPDREDIPGVGEMLLVGFYPSIPDQEYTLPGIPPNRFGASAYEIAVANGFVGTEQEWLQSINYSTNNPNPSGFNHQQQAPSDEWVINHNLGFIPSVELFNGSGQEIDADVTHPSIYQTIIYFTTPVSGFARLL